MPRILRIINRLNLGGPTYNAALLTKHLAPEYETLLVAGHKKDTEASSEFILNDLGVSATYVEGMHRAINPLQDYTAYRRLKAIIKQYKPDIVHTHAAKAGALGRLAAAACQVPVVIHTFHGHVFHSYFSKPKTRLFLEIERHLAKKSQAIVAISKQQKHELSHIYQVCEEDKINTIPLGFDLTRFQHQITDKRIDFRQQYHIKYNELAIGLVGRLVPIKNHKLFLQALQQLKATTNKKIRAFIIGDGESRADLENEAAALGLSFVNDAQAKNGKSALVTFTSWITNIDWAYAGLDVVALSSLNEGTPVSLIEAQASNKPVISTNVGGVCDVLRANQTALLTPSNNAAAFAEALYQMAEQEDLRLQMGQRGYRHVKDAYCYTRLVADMDKLYDKALWAASPTYRQQKRMHLIHTNANQPLTLGQANKDNTLAKTPAPASVIPYGNKVSALYK